MDLAEPVNDTNVREGESNEPARDSIPYRALGRSQPEAGLRQTRKQVNYVFRRTPKQQMISGFLSLYLE